MTSCDDMLEVSDLNSQTTYDFADSEEELNEAIIACYNNIRLEGTYSRVGYTLDMVRGDEVWNPGQVWYLEYDNFTAATDNEIGNLWPWRDAYYIVNHTNLVLSRVDDVEMSSDSYNEIKGQALFLRGLAYYHLVTYYQTAPLITDYADYSDISTLYATSNTQDEVFNQIEADLTTAMQILPSRDEGGEWAGGRATSGAAAGFLARAFMFRHKFDSALIVLEDIIAGTYGTYALTDDYGDNFKEDTENNEESLFEVQFMDYGTGGTNQEWTPVNIIATEEATQGHAVESNCGPVNFGSWGDLAGSVWLYNLFKKENCSDGRLDPRLYWTLNTYEAEYDIYTGVSTDAYPDGDPRCNVVYQTEIDSTPVCNASGGISIAKNTNSRNNLYSSIDQGLYCGVNLRLMRYSDVLLRAAECENEVNGPTQKAIDYINEVRNRAALADLQLTDFPTADHLFEQIANVERPKEFGCEYGRGIDLIRWGVFYDADRLQQMVEHSYWVRKNKANLEELTAETAQSSPFNYFTAGHEYFPIYQEELDNNSNLVGNSANKNYDNTEAFLEKYGQDAIRPVVDLD